jgi:hypothetical protein
MSTDTHHSLRRAGIAFIVGALITAIGGAVVQGFVQPSTTVSDDMWSYPWSSDALVPISLLWAFAHLLIIAGLLGFRRSGMAGPSRTAATGLALAVIGTSLLLVGELASIPFRYEHIDDTGPGIVGGVFGIATLLSAIGLLMGGKATLRAGQWRDWRRFTPLVAGIWTLILVGLALTKALPTAVGIYGLCLLALGIALYTRPSPVATAPAVAQMHGASAA